MRLTAAQVREIRRITAEELGAEARLWLFGSRADDAKRGGDVDLYVEVDRALPNRVLKAARLAARIERSLEGLPVDVVLRDAETVAQPIHDLARSTGRRL